MSEKTRTIEDLAKEALAVQDASNLVGIARSFAAAMAELMRIEKLGTRDVCTHAVTQAWVSKIISMVYITDNCFRTCDEIARQNNKE